MWCTSGFFSSALSISSILALASTKSPTDGCEPEAKWLMAVWSCHSSLSSRTAATGSVDAAIEETTASPSRDR